MPNSYSAEIDYSCESCGKETTVQTWLIIDAAEKPDLIEQVKNETLHKLDCPGCGEPIPLDPPLLLYFLGDEPRFLYASRQQDGTGFPEDMIQEIFDELVESSGDQELKDQYHHHQAWVLKEDLPDRLKDYPNKPLREFDWTAYPALKQCEMLMVDDYLQMVMTDYFGTPDWNRRRMVVERAPLLLTPAIEPWLESQEEAFLEMGNDQNLQIIRDHLEILTRAREVGYYEAVLEFQQKQEELN